MSLDQEYSSDAPVKTPEEDKFSRWPFAERVAKVIANRKDPSSIIIGLYGTWGDGKTSVLNFIETALEENDHVVCIRFNPWRYGSEEQLLERFFFDIANAIDAAIVTSGEKIRQFLDKVVVPIGEASGSKAIGEGISKFLTGPNLIQLRERIETALETAEKRVVIFVDDIDRLEKEEIHATFRLVKLTADFKNTAYVLAFDDGVVSAALQERYASRTGNAGRSFLEKIIQVPLHLPGVDSRTLKAFCFQGVDEALRIAEIELNDEQVQFFATSFRTLRCFGHFVLAGREKPVSGILED